MSSWNRFTVLFTAIAILIPPVSHACSRAVYLGPGDTIITIRSMDWQYDLGSNLWVFPRGMERDGAAGPNSIRWTSKYGSVVTSAFEGCTADDMNEAGLVANLLALTESQYVVAAEGDRRQPLSISAWTQYVLDNYATVAEAVEDIRNEPFYVLSAKTPDGRDGNMHLAISDPTGDSAIFEYINGELVIHHGREYQVMTNSPTYDQQLALNSYWQQIGGTTMLPGTNRAADRFARASFYINAISQTSDINEAVAAAFSVIRNVSVPIGITTPNQPEIATTLWRTVSDHKYRRYFFETTRSPNVFWVALDDLDFSEGADTLKLTLTGGEFYAGNAAAEFVPAEPFEFIASKVE